MDLLPSPRLSEGESKLTDGELRVNRFTNSYMYFTTLSLVVRSFFLPQRGRLALRTTRRPSL